MRYSIFAGGKDCDRFSFKSADSLMFLMPMPSALAPRSNLFTPIPWFMMTCLPWTTVICGAASRRLIKFDEATAIIAGDAF